MTAMQLELMARAVHESYRQKQLARGDSVDRNPSMHLWEDLPEDLRRENRNQAAFIEEQLHRLGYGLVPRAHTGAVSIDFSSDEVETMSQREHDRFVRSKRDRGWTYGPVRDDKGKKHPCLVPWNDLSELEREKDREAVRNIPALATLAGFSLVRHRGLASRSEPS